ncbi:MAG: hypothetical protein NW241_06915 [Bacteroidia bacterium]|nr:hypothetical protein [Bacteroidia bacterium]
MSRFRLLILLTPALLMSSCLIRFSYKEKRKALHYRAEALPGMEDTLRVQNYFLCKLYRYGPLDLRGQPVEIPADSTWAYFRTALEAQPLRLAFQAPGQAACDSVLARNQRLRKGQIDLGEVRAWGQVRDDGRLRLVPIIHIEYLFRSHMYAAGAGFASSGLLRNIFLTTHVYMFRGEELVFSRGMYYIADTEYLDTHEDPVTSLEQKHWNELVRLMLKPYVKELQ